MVVIEPGGMTEMSTRLAMDPEATRTRSRPIAAATMVSPRTVRAVPTTVVLNVSPARTFRQRSRPVARATNDSPTKRAVSLGATLISASTSG